MKKNIVIDGMSCGHCVSRVEKVLKQLSGVEAVLVDLANKLVKVDLSKDIDDAVLKEVIDEAGYDVIEIENV